MITNKDTGWTEATVTINGRELTFAESMSLRVAVGTFRMTLAGEDFRRDLGPVADGYDLHLENIERMLVTR